MDVLRAPSDPSIKLRDRLTAGIAQIAPVWLDRDGTLGKVERAIEQAADERCALLAFGEALVPGYPFWLEHSGAARFDDPRQKAMYANYLEQSVSIESGHLDRVCDVARSASLAIYLGIVERALDRGGHSLYCSLVYIDKRGQIASVHRKLQPTHEERLVWAPGDGHGLRVHDCTPFQVGGLNCFENWMPLPRAALYGQGEDLHVAAWPGGEHNTADITRFIARESRSYVLSASALLTMDGIEAEFAAREDMQASGRASFANGGSAIARPNGEFLVSPQVDRELLIIADLDHGEVRRERQIFDVAGHYSRPDVTRLTVDRKRQSTIDLHD